MDIILVTQKTLEDTSLLLSKLNNTLYNQTIPALFNGTLGKQIRHLIELYQCLLFRSNNVVNYDERARNPLLETKIEVAKASIQDLITHIPKTQLHETLILKSMLSPSQEISTTLARELLYLHDHSIHHLALIRVGIQLIQPDVSLPAHLGVALSTLEYEEMVKK